ncbi:molybdate ABC transporter substrate-binding protein [Occultella gossypii]|uniref:Molybdate ABC transporter substrate-binding protein n=1 Tax=Occultella gossypii TaxID=2800820 RepID=A0ABS7SFQ6_9MICO|nr:molybdate ABC transporter substrate-binding protein [Occultella gossypii]MBZ2199184.1 molybdate ABC transporter substrate-binding protein [Occultella gossypii]
MTPSPTARRGPRRLIALLGATAAGLAMVACSSGGGAEDPADAGSESDSGGGTSGSAGDVGGTLTVFAAASLQEAFDVLLAAFGEQHPDVEVAPAVYDGSATLATQLEEGAGADVLATANEDTMERITTAGLEASTPEPFATNTLVIAVPTGNPEGIADLPDLNDTTFVICAPAVPCGDATVELFGLTGFAGAPVSQEQNVTAVAERVVNGDVGAGLVYGTDVAARSGELEAVVPTGADDVVNNYPIVELEGAQPAAAPFVEFVLSDEGQAVLSEHGFGAP